MKQSRTRRAALAVLALSTAAATTLGTSTTAGAVRAADTPALPAPVSTSTIDVPSAKLRGIDRTQRGEQTVFVRLAGSGSADVASTNRRRVSDEVEVADRRAEVRQQGREVLATAKRSDAAATKLFTISNALPGVALRVNQEGLEAVAALPEVVKVSTIVPKQVTNASAAALTRAVNVWKYSRGLGRGVRIGIIDTGIDYTHKAFGGPGTVGAYDAASKRSADPHWRNRLPSLARAKVASGVDFVGDSYDPEPTLDDGTENPDYDPVARRDENPLDCAGHGTHVSGTAAGYGVTAERATFTGDYAALTRSSLLDMVVGPGMAPRAEIHPLKVFGCQGGTSYVLPALDWALDPNGDGDFADHLDLLNLSLGTSDTATDDPENAVINELTSHGVTSVVAAGNDGDLTDTGGSPGNAVSSLSVASTRDSLQVRDALRVDAPDQVAGLTGGQMSANYDWASNGPSRRPVSAAVAQVPGDNADGCSPLTAAQASKVKGKAAWLEWDSDDSTRRCGSVGRSRNILSAGAVGAVLTSSEDVFAAGIAGDETIPVFQLSKQGTDKLRGAAAAGTLEVSFDGRDAASLKDDDDSITDTLSISSSRGVHGSAGVVKPDVAAPGDTITSAAMGTGASSLTSSGTSMATPVATGIAALVLSRHRGYSPLLTKAAVMNNADHDVWSGPAGTGHRYAPARVGSGRVDALRAVNASVIAYSPGARNPVSASFGVVPAPVDQGVTLRTLPLKVLNKSSRSRTFRLTYEAVVTQPGVSYSVSPTTLRLAPNSRGTATVTMRIDPVSLRHTIDPTMSTTQLGLARQYVSDASGRLLVTPAGEGSARVPVYGAAKPVSATTASAQGRRIMLNGTGFAQGTGSTQWTSLTSVLQFGARSGELPDCRLGERTGCISAESQRSGDLQSVGAGSTGDWLWFGLSMQADWAKMGTNVYAYVDFDLTGDGSPDYETVLQNADSSDVLLSVTYDLNDPDTDPMIAPANFNLGDVDTNAFDNNVVLLPVSKRALGIGSRSRPITYTVSTDARYYSPDGVIGFGPLDTVGPINFNAGDPSLKTAAPLYEDAGGTGIGYSLRKRAKALVLHLHGAAGKRAEVLELPSRPYSDSPRPVR